MNKKKFFTIAVALIAVFSLCSCGNKSGDTVTTAEKTTETQTTVQETTAPKAQVAVLESINIKNTITDDEKTISGIVLDEYGRITGFERSGGKGTLKYNEDGLLVQCSFEDKSGKTEVESWDYENGIPVASHYDNGGTYRSNRETEIEADVNEEGQVTQLTESNTFTDSDGEVSDDHIIYILNYDNEKRVASDEYYIHDEEKYDHTSRITYDENGNITNITNNGSKGDYLFIDYNYKLVDEDTVKAAPEISAFNTYFNTTCFLNELL